MTQTPPAAATPAISVIVPVYNVADHVAACIDSLRAQSLTDFEAIVVDDGSTDDSAARAQAAARGDPRFRFVDRRNGGLSAARNSGLALARGGFIAFLDSDDRLHPEFLARMHAALERTGADWVACAIRYVHPDGSGVVHSAIHGAPDLPDPAPRDPARHALTDWGAVIRHFPSAWNKLYRRHLIEGLWFDEGTYFEDHAFYWRAARRSTVLLHLAEPLYLQTQGRAGQITREDSERVFEQFAVLDTLRGIMAGSDKTGAGAAFAGIASRLVFERSCSIGDPQRRARFAAAARAFFTRHSIAWSPDWDAGIARSWGLVMAGRCPLSVIVPSDGNLAALAVTLDALAAQSLRDLEVIVVPDRPAEATRRALLAAVAASACPGVSVLVQAGAAGTEAGEGLQDRPQQAVQDAGHEGLHDPGAGAAAARNLGLRAAQGEHVVFLDAGDRMGPDTLGAWVEAMIRAEADFGFARIRMGAGGPLHAGLHDATGAAAGLRPGPVQTGPDLALRLHAHPSAKIFRRDFLQVQGIGFAPGPLASWGVVLRAALLARRAVLLAPEAEISTDPACRRLWRAPVPAVVLDRAVAGLAAGLERDLPAGVMAALPGGWQVRLLVRAVWEKTGFADFPDPGAVAAFTAEAAALLRARWPLPPGGLRLDPYVGADLRAALGLPAQDPGQNPAQDPGEDFPGDPAEAGHTQTALPGKA